MQQDKGEVCGSSVGQRKFEMECQKAIRKEVDELKYKRHVGKKNKKK